jgi:hypothetical protein
MAGNLLLKKRLLRARPPHHTRNAVHEAPASFPASTIANDHPLWATCGNLFFFCCMVPVPIYISSLSHSSLLLTPVSMRSLWGRAALIAPHSHSGLRAPLVLFFFLSFCHLLAVLSITSPPQATQRTLTAVELDEIKRKHQHSLVIQRERIKEEQTRKYGAPIGQAFL